MLGNRASDYVGVGITRSWLPFFSVSFVKVHVNCSSDFRRQYFSTSWFSASQSSRFAPRRAIRGDHCCKANYDCCRFFDAQRVCVCRGTPHFPFSTATRFERLRVAKTNVDEACGFAADSANCFIQLGPHESGERRHFLLFKGACHWSDFQRRRPPTRRSE